MKLQRKKFALNFNGLTSAYYTCGKGDNSLRKFMLMILLVVR
nr:MAG TPA: hypothetical protein [Caudoviricetes sp.]